MEVKFTNPFTTKSQALKAAAAGSCQGCGDTLPTMNGDDTVRVWCSKPKRVDCRKLYRAQTRVRTATRYA